MNKTAKDWINADKQGILDDLLHLSPNEAIDYQMSLIEECKIKGDHRWDNITKEDMKTELNSLMCNFFEYCYYGKKAY